MKIRYLVGPRAGQTDHVPHSQEIQTLINAGIIEGVPYRDFRERLAEEGQGMKTPDPNAVSGVLWSVIERTAPTPEGLALICRCSGTEVVYGLPGAFPDCPKPTLVRFYELNKVENAESFAEQEIQRRYKAEAEAQKQRERENGAAVARFGKGILHGTKQ